MHSTSAHDRKTRALALLKRMTACGWRAHEIIDAAQMFLEFETVLSLMPCEFAYVYSELRETRCSPVDLRVAGCSCADMLDFGFSIQTLKRCGYTVNDFQHCRVTANQLTGVFPLSQMLIHGYTAEHCLDAGYTSCEINASVPRVILSASVQKTPDAAPGSKGSYQLLPSDVVTHVSQFLYVDVSKATGIMKWRLLRTMLESLLRVGSKRTPGSSQESINLRRWAYGAKEQRKQPNDLVRTSAGCHWQVLSLQVVREKAHRCYVCITVQPNGRHGTYCKIVNMEMCPSRVVRRILQRNLSNVTLLSGTPPDASTGPCLETLPSVMLLEEGFAAACRQWRAPCVCVRARAQRSLSFVRESSQARSATA